MSDATVSFPGSNVPTDCKSWISLLGNTLVNDLSWDSDGVKRDRSSSAEIPFELLKKADPSWDLSICEISEIAELALFFSDL